MVWPLTLGIKPRLSYHGIASGSIIHHGDDRNIADRCPIEHPRIEGSGIRTFADAGSTASTQCMPAPKHFDMIPCITEIVVRSHITESVPASNAVGRINSPRNLKKHCNQYNGFLFKLFIKTVKKWSQRTFVMLLFNNHPSSTGALNFQFDALSAHCALH